MPPLRGEALRTGARARHENFLRLLAILAASMPYLAGAATAIGVEGTESSAYVNLAVDSRGNAVAVWTGRLEGGYRIFWNRYDAARATWGQPAPLDSHGLSKGLADQATVIFDSHDTAVAVWDKWVDGGSRIWVSWLDAATLRWSEAERLPSNTEGTPHEAMTYAPRLSHDATGKAVLTWIEGSDWRGDTYVERLGTAIIDVAARTVSGPGWAGDARAGLYYATAHRAGCDPALVATTRRAEDRRVVVQRYDSSTAAWRPEVALGENDAPPNYFPWLAVDGDCQAFVTWREKNAGRILVARDNGTGRWEAATHREAHLSNRDAQLATSFGGRIVLARQTDDAFALDTWKNAAWSSSRSLRVARRICNQFLVLPFERGPAVLWRELVGTQGRMVALGALKAPPPAQADFDDTLGANIRAEPIAPDKVLVVWSGTSGGRTNVWAQVFEAR